MTDWGARAQSILNELATCSEPGPGVTRLPFTPEHRAAIDLLCAQMKMLDLDAELDHAGTLIGRLEGPPGSKTLLMGSHQDSVREGGGYDGIMGVVLPLMALAKLRFDGIKLPFSVEVLAFADEEGVRFPTALIGSRALAGTFDAAVLSMTDSQGITLRDAMEEFGLEPDRIGALTRNPDGVLGFVEAHIEQGPVLENEELPIGVVTGGQGQRWYEATITGMEAHFAASCGAPCWKWRITITSP